MFKGKKIGTCTYLHKSAISLLPEDQQTLIFEAMQALVHKKHDSDIVRIDSSTSSVTFIDCPTFDYLQEPLVGDSIKVTAGIAGKLWKATANPRIYHHKWSFVSSDYTGFDVEKSMARSTAWTSHPLYRKEDSPMIGYLNYWNQVLARLGMANG